jgi:hypothetical protein
MLLMSVCLALLRRRRAFVPSCRPATLALYYSLHPSNSKRINKNEFMNNSQEGLSSFLSFSRANGRRASSSSSSQRREAAVACIYRGNSRRLNYGKARERRKRSHRKNDFLNHGPARTYVYCIRRDAFREKKTTTAAAAAAKPNSSATPSNRQQPRRKCVCFLFLFLCVCLV